MGGSDPAAGEADRRGHGAILRGAGAPPFPDQGAGEREPAEISPAESGVPGGVRHGRRGVAHHEKTPQADTRGARPVGPDGPIPQPSIILLPSRL